jgi:hypothetical protein
MLYQNNFFNRQYSYYLKRGKRMNFNDVTIPENVKTKETENHVYFYGVSENNPIIHNDYPWGYRFRTKQKYWIESNKKGMRLCYQTMNPKTGRWCAVKKTTYSDIRVLLIEKHTGHVKNIGLNYAYSDSSEIREFIEKHSEGLGSEVSNFALNIARLKDEYSKKMDERKEEVKKEREERRPLDLSEKLLWQENEIVKNPTDLELYRITLSCHGIKKRCRKADHHIVRIGFTTRDISLSELTEKLNNMGVVQEKIDSYFRECHSAILRVQKTTFNAPKDDSIFYSFTSMLMSSELDRRVI